MIELHLYIGRRDTGVTIVPDQGLWRVVWPDGQVSPMGNLTRAKDAALMFAKQGRSVHRWECTETAVEAPPAAVTGVAATCGSVKRVAAAGDASTAVSAHIRLQVGKLVIRCPIADSERAVSVLMRRKARRAMRPPTRLVPPPPGLGVSCT